MDILNYGKKIGIEFNELEKMDKFKNLMYNQLDNIHEIHCCYNPNIEHEICKNFFNVLCIENNKYYFSEIKYILKELKNDKIFIYYISIFLSLYYIADKEKCIVLLNLIKTIMHMNAINYYIEIKDDMVCIFPKGNTELDDKLIIEPLEWLSKYPEVRGLAIQSMQSYYNPNGEQVSEIVDKFRKVLEQFFKAYFNTDKSLENVLKDGMYGNKIESAGVSKEIANLLSKIVDVYAKYNNEHAKHDIDAKRYDVEYIMYETFNIIRLLLQIQ